MKKLLTLLSVMMLAGGAMAQFNFNTNTNIGQTLSGLQIQNPDTFVVHYNTALGTSTWAPARAAASLGKDSVRIVKCQTQRGIQVKGFLNATTTTAYEAGNFKSNNHGANGNPVHVYSIDSLKNIMRKSIITGTINGGSSDSITRPAACLFDVAPGDQAFGMYPGKVKKIEYVFRFNFGGKTATSDVEFDMFTYDAGTTGKTADYKLAVYTSSTFTDVNLLAPAVSTIYTTGGAKKRVKVAEALGVPFTSFTNKTIYIVISTLGTTNASGVADGEAHGVTAGNEPVAYDPTIVFDNMQVMYQNPAWVVPAGAIANSVFNHNNGAPVVTVSTDYTGGTAVPVTAGVETAVKINLQGNGRVGTLTITEGNDGGGHSAAYTFAETGAIKQKDGLGEYTIDVPYTRTINETSGVYTLTVAAPAAGSSNDDLQVTTLATVPADATRAIRLEINNGVRFWYNVAATGTISTATTSVDGKLYLTAEAGSVTLHGIESGKQVTVYNTAGQLVHQALSTAGEMKIELAKGLYIIQAEGLTSKVIVR